MHSVLLVLGSLENASATASTAAWRSFSQKVLDIADSLDQTRRISANVWMLPLPSGLPTFSFLTALAVQHGLPYQVLFFQDAPSWVSYSQVEEDH